ncbi:MAG: hypothetical protein Kapaf2KO_13420 [Candidatus Kapaibacteriales bacterium]
MKIEYFKETDTLYIDLKDTPSVESRSVSRGIVLDYDENGELTGIEIDNASKVSDIYSLISKSLPIRNLEMA